MLVEDLLQLGFPNPYSREVDHEEGVDDGLFCQYGV